MSLIIRTSYLPYAICGEAYSVTLQAEAHPVRKIMWSVAGYTALPLGLKLNVQGEISGIPSKAQQTSVQITATAEEPHEVNYVILNISVYEAPPQELAICHQNLSCEINQSCRIELAAQGGRPPYKWSCDSLPLGLTLSDDKITGCVHVSGGSAPVTLTVRDSVGNMVSKSVLLKIISRL